MLFFIYFRAAYLNIRENYKDKFKQNSFRVFLWAGLVMVVFKIIWAYCYLLNYDNFRMQFICILFNICTYQSQDDMNITFWKSWPPSSKRSCCSAHSHPWWWTSYFKPKTTKTVTKEAEFQWTRPSSHWCTARSYYMGWGARGSTISTIINARGNFH